MNEKPTKYLKLGDVLNVITNYRYTDLMFEDIKRLKTVDAVSVIKCKDCVFSKDYTQDGWIFCRRLNCSMKMYDFCSYGERK